MFSRIKTGDEVAIMPGIGADPEDTLEIASVNYAGAVFLVLNDGRAFSTTDGHGINNPLCIQLATTEHRAAVKPKTVGE